MSHPVPTPPTKIRLSNLYPGSNHQDVTVFQAAIVRTFGITNLPIDGYYGKQTLAAVKNLSLKAKKLGSDIQLRYGRRLEDAVPHENFIRMVGLEVR